MIKNIKLLNSMNLNNISFEDICFFNFISEITLTFCNNDSFNLELYEDFKNTIDSINLNSSKFYYVLLYFVSVLNSSGVIKIFSNDFEKSKESLFNFFEYNKLNKFINLLDCLTINTLLLQNKKIDKELFKKCFFVLTLIYESSFNQKLNSSELIYII